MTLMPLLRWQNRDIYCHIMLRVLRSFLAMVWLTGLVGCGLAPVTPLPATAVAPTAASASPASSDVQATGAPALQAILPSPKSASGAWLVYSRADNSSLVAQPASGNAVEIVLKTPIAYPADIAAAVSAASTIALRTGTPSGADLALTLVHFPDGKISPATPLLSSVLQEQIKARPADPLPAAATAVNQPDTLAWSPDGRSLAFVGAQDGPSSDLYLLDTTSGNIKRLTTGANQVAHPVWSQDGLWVLFEEVLSFGATTPAPRRVYKLWAAATDHSELRQLYLAPANSDSEQILAWDGSNTFLVGTQVGSYLHDLRLVPTSARRTDIVYGGPVNAAAYDPGEHVLAFIVDDKTGPELGLAPGVYRLDDPKNQPQLVQPGEWNGLSYAASLGRFFGSGPQGLLLFSPTGENTLIQKETNASASPDGLWLAGWGSGARLYAPNGELMQQFSTDPVDQLVWSPDSKSLAYHANHKVFALSFPDMSPKQLPADAAPGSLTWIVP
jgi:hypothetical protein